MGNLAKQGSAFSAEGFEKLQRIYTQVYEILDSIDGLVEELKTLNKQTEDDDDDDNKSDERGKPDSSELVPVDGGHHEKRSFILDGIDLIVDQIAEGEEIFTPDMLQKAMGDGWSKPRANLYNRHLGEGEDFTITTEKFKDYLKTHQNKNVGVGVAAICTALMNMLKTVEMPDMIKDIADIACNLAAPLIDFAFAFGLLLANEELREHVQDDPEEVCHVDMDFVTFT